MSNLTVNTENMSRKQLLNVGRLIAKAGELEFPIDSDMTQVGYNNVYGNTYLWCEGVQYTLFISDFGSRIKVLYSCPYDGEETERLAGNDETKLDKWVSKLVLKSETKDNQD